MTGPLTVCARAGTGHAVELDVAVDVAGDEIAGDVVDDDAAFIHGSCLYIDVAGNVEDEIHFDDVAVVRRGGGASPATVFTLQRNGPLT